MLPPPAHRFSVSRRLLFMFAGSLALAGCDKKEVEAASNPAAAPASSARRPPRTSPSRSASSTSAPSDDYGYNQAHAEGAAALKKMPGVKVVEEENVPETVDVQKTMESMIELDGAKLLFPTSFGYFDPHMLEDGREVPGGARSCTAAASTTEGKHPKNVGSYFGYIDEVPVPPASSPATPPRRRSSASSPPSRSRRCCATSTPSRSARAVGRPEGHHAPSSSPATGRCRSRRPRRPTASSTRAWTCSPATWTSPKVIVETAEKRGIYICGYHASQAALAPKGYLTGAEWNWAKVYTDYVTTVREGEKPYPHLAARRPQGRLRQAVALRPGGRGRDQDEGRRRPRPS